MSFQPGSLYEYFQKFRIWCFCSRRILLPTPQKGPKLSKEEYRRRFEEQVKANDELAEHYKQMILIAVDS